MSNKTVSYAFVSVLLLSAILGAFVITPVAAPAIIITPIGEVITVLSNETFVLAYKMEWNEPDSLELDYLNYFSVTVYWDCDDTTPHLNFTYIDYVCKYVHNGSDVPLSGWHLKKKIPDGSTTPRYILSHYQYDGVWGNGEFWLNVTMRAAGVVGGSYTPHVGGDQIITISKVRCNEETTLAVGPGDATIRVVPRIFSCDSTGHPKEVFNVALGEAVFVKGHGFGSGATMRLYVLQNTTWVQDQTWTIGDDVRGAFNVTSADSGGNLATFRLGLLPVGEYDIVADVYPYGRYNNATDAVDDPTSSPGVTVTGVPTPPPPTVTVDGDPSDWIGTPPPTNTGTYSEFEYIWTDEVGDDTGNGTYTYPYAQIIVDTVERPAFSPGDFDLTELRITRDSSYVYFLLTFDNVTDNGWVPDAGWLSDPIQAETTAVAICIDTDRVEGAGMAMVDNTEEGTGSVRADILLPSSCLWEYLIEICLEDVVLWWYDGLFVTEAYRNFPIAANTMLYETIEFAIPIDPAGEAGLPDPNGETWALFAFVGSQDFQHFREVASAEEATINPWAAGGGEGFGGADDVGPDPDAFDCAFFATKADQEEALNAFGPGPEDYAVISAYMEIDMNFPSIPVPYEHELTVSLDAPTHLNLGESYLLKATVYNIGLSNETNVDLYLLINGTEVNSTTILELVTGTSYTIEYLWTPTVEGTYNITAYAPPIPNETVTVNNIEKKIVKVRQVRGFIVFEEAHLPAYTIGSNPADDVTGGYAEFADYLTIHGYIVSTIDPGTVVDPSVLASVDVLVIVAPQRSYSTSEIDAIENWVKGGGKLLLISNWNDFALQANTIATRFSVSLSLDGILDSDENVGDYSLWPYYDGANLRTHPITAGVNRVEMYAGDGIASAPADEIPLIVTDSDGTATWYTGSLALGVSVMSAIDGGTAGSGRLVIITDSNIWDSAYDLDGDGDIDFYDSDNELLALNSIEWLTVRYEHELTVTLEAPTFVEPSESSLLNATVYNRGLNNETNVDLFLLINGTVVNSTRIPKLLTGSSYTIDYLWTPTVEATYNVTAYALPVPNETYTTNNVYSKYVTVAFMPRILAYVEYTDYYQECANALAAIDSTFGPNYILTELWDYTQLDSILPGNDILFIPEQEYASLSTLFLIGEAWSTTLSNFMNEAGIIILCDHSGGTYGILTGAGLMSISGCNYITWATIYLVNPSDPLASGVSSDFTAPYGALSFVTRETNVVFDDGTWPVVIHKTIGQGQIILIGFDYYESNPDTQRIIGNAVGLALLVRRYITATIDINPDTLNLWSKGEWITCYIELPESYNPSDIDISTILLNDTLTIDPDAPTEIGDYDNDGIPDLMIKFDRSEVISLLTFGNQTIEITGQLTDGTLFGGTNEIIGIHARITLNSLNTVNLHVNGTFIHGASIKIKFYDYLGIYQGETTIWSGTTPTRIILTTDLTLDSPVENATLVLTDSDGNVLLNLATFVVHRSDLIQRLGELDAAWTSALPSERQAIITEFVAIDAQWPYAPP